VKQYLELELSDFQGLDDRLTEAESRLAAIEKKYDSDITAIKASLDAHGKGLSTLTANDVDKDKRVKVLEAWKPSADATMVANEGKIKDLVTRMTKAEADALSLDARLDKAEPVLVTLATRLDQNDAKDKGQDTAESGLDARAKLLEAYKDVVAKTLADYATRLAALEKPVLPKAPEPQT
jgi:hypothetical protein